MSYLDVIHTVLQGVILNARYIFAGFHSWRVVNCVLAEFLGFILSDTSRWPSRLGWSVVRINWTEGFTTLVWFADWFSGWLSWFLTPLTCNIKYFKIVNTIGIL